MRREQAIGGIIFKTLSLAALAAALLAAPVNATTQFTDLGAWIVALPEAPDFTEDFESDYTDGEIFTGVGTLTITPGATIESGSGSISSSNPIDVFALELPSGSGLIATLTFSQPISYFGFFHIDAGTPEIGGVSFPSSAASGDSAEFGGLIFDPSENITELTIRSVSGDSTWALDNLYWGYDDPTAIPVPAALPLLAGGLGLLAFLRRRT